MLRSEAITIIKRGLGFRQTQDAAIIAALQQAQRELETGKTLPDWLIEYYLPIPYVGDTVALPERFLRIHEEYPLGWVDPVSGDGGSLPRRWPEEANEAYPNPTPREPGAPQVWILQADHIRLQPLVTTPLTLYMTYYKGAEVLDSDIENAWLEHVPDYLIGVAGVIVASNLRDVGAAQAFNGQAARGQKAFIGSVVEAELAGRPLMMGRNN